MIILAWLYYVLLLSSYSKVVLLYKVKVIDLVPVNDYNAPLISSLDKGRPVQNFKSVVLEDALVREQFCDFQVGFEPHSRLDWGYVPSICEERGSCTDPFPVGESVQKTCKAFGDTRQPQSNAQYICCPINATRFYINQQASAEPDVDLSYNFYEFSEIPTNFKLFQGYDYTILTGRNSEKVEDKLILEAALDPDYRERIRKELVCGFKRGRKLSGPQSQNYIRVPYFCVPPDKCNYEANAPHPAWHEFCQNQLQPSNNQDGKTICCRVDSITKDFFNFDYVHLPQLPLFLKYAPGLRSAFKCEEYSRLVCSEDDPQSSMCVPVDTTKPPEPNQIPYVALIGFVTPKLMLFHCGGALISTRYVLSSAACSQYFGYTTNVALLGEYDIAEVLEVLKLEKTYLISEILPYQQSGFHLKEGEQPRSVFDTVDLALYKTDVDVEMSYSIRPACLYYRPFTWPDRLNFVGFGTKDLGTKRSDLLKIISLPLLERSRCLTSTYYFDETENPYYTRYGVKQEWLTCYGNRDDAYRAPCKYDTGGPLQAELDQPYCSQQVLGILSTFRHDCSQPQPSVFTNVTKFVAEIEDEIWGDYTFLDIFDADLQTPKCGDFRDLYFKETCPPGAAYCADNA